MKRLLFSALVAAAFPAAAITPEAEEFMRIAKELEPVHCEKRKLRRWIALADVEGKREEAAGMRKRFAQLDKDPKTARLERRLGELEKRLSNGRGGTLDPADLEAINRQQREAFYRCE